MLASDLSLAAPPLASRYEAMWGCDDVEFPASIAYLQEFEHPQAEGIEPHHTIRACRRAEDRKRATDHMVGPRIISRAEADVLCKLKLLGYFADGGKCFADYCGLYDPRHEVARAQNRRCPVSHGAPRRELGFRRCLHQ